MTFQDYAILTFVFLFGLCIGSFLNVCILRIPESLSIVRPPSSCPACATPIKYYDNIPVFSYLLLGGKCRSCKTPISLRYPLVELLTGLLALSILIKFGLTIEFLIFFLFAATLLVITFIDIDHRIIPDLISLPGIPIFFFASLALSSVTISDSALGILAGGGILFAISQFWSRFREIEAMGMGDVKLLAMIGALIGWQGVFFTIFVSSVLGSLVGLPLMLVKGKGLKMEIPFGPFLAMGAIAYLFFGPEALDWYFSF